MDAKECQRPIADTPPTVGRRYGLGPKKMYRLIAGGAFPAYDTGNGRRLVFFADVEKWLLSGRVPVTDHAAQRVAEVLEREERGGGAA